MKILILGLPGSGKTTLATALCSKIGAVHLNADTMRNRVWTDLDFSMQSRKTQAQRMGALSDVLNEQGFDTVADFVCPTQETREQFGDCFTIWIDRIEAGRFEDTNKLFVAPQQYDLRIVSGLTVKQEVKEVLSAIGRIRTSKETSIRSLIKAVSWRITGTIDTFFVSWFVTGQPLIASGIALTEIFTKVGLFWAHERIWNKINWNRN
jgi:adenylylsulfate kinase